MKDKVLRELLGYEEGYHCDELTSLEKFKERFEKIENRLSKLFVPDYFKDCPCCQGQGEILKSEAVSFKKFRPSIGNVYRGFYTDGGMVTFYTTKKSYDIHKKVIDEWAKEIKAYNAKS